MFEHKPGRGSAFKNRYKTTAEHPYYKGSCKTPDGKDWDLAIWVNKVEEGPATLSLQFQEPRNIDKGHDSRGKPGPSDNPPKRNRPWNEELDDEIL